jgi:hypothetical protein
MKPLPPDPYRPPPSTHRGPAGRVRARRWAGIHGDGIAEFLDGPGTVSFWFTGYPPQIRLFLDLEDGLVQVAFPGDWVVWCGEECRIVPADDFDTDYHPIR